MSTSTRTTFSLDSTSSIESRRTRSRETTFFNKHGHRHHSYDPEKAPYPQSYDKEVLGLDLLDHGFMLKVQPNVTFVDFKGNPPTSVLDLGCGTGAWIIEAAKQWPNCTFVGFDLVNIQPPASYLDRSIADRIRWVHGNFLTTKLPFDDDEFDLVHMKCISRGVPENKWSVLYQDVHRVLCPGGIMESVEEDIRFPTLPRWFTTPLRATRRAASIHLPDGSQLSTPSLTCRGDLPHQHALLESLFYSIFETRFINTRPTAILPAQASAIFRHVRVAPIWNVKMPPFASVLPYPESEVMTAQAPPIPVDVTNGDTSNPSPSPKATLSETSLSDFDTCGSSMEDQDDSASFRTASSRSSLDNSPRNDSYQMKRHPSLLNISYAPPEETTSVGFTDDSNMIQIPMKALMTFAPETMATHLYCAYTGVLACQEAMWEELKDRVRNRPAELEALGWDDDELEELQGRKKFETLIQRYRDDMHCRVALWRSLSNMGWEIPPQGPLTRAEIAEEDRVRKAMLAASKSATDEDTQTPCRSIRVIVGIKGSG